MKLEKAIEIKEHNRHRGILCPTPEEFEADDLSIEALKRLQAKRELGIHYDQTLLLGETKE